MLWNKFSSRRKECSWGKPTSGYCRNAKSNHRRNRPTEIICSNSRPSEQLIAGVSSVLSMSSNLVRGSYRFAALPGLAGQKPLAGQLH